MKTTKEQEIIKTLFKDFQTSYNSRSISKIVGISHPGAFKILKNLEKIEIVKSKKIGKASVYSLNLDNPIACKELEKILTIEAQNNKRWIEEFKTLEDKSEFVILFGSILTNEKTAKDVDILVVAEKTNFNKIKKIVYGRDKLSNKKMHLIIQQPKEFKKDLINENKVTLEIIKNGIVLFGQDKLRKMFQNVTIQE